MPKDFAANLDFHTGDGHIELNLPVTVSGRVGRQVRGTINGGGELLTVKTGGGSITLEPCSPSLIAVMGLTPEGSPDLCH